MHMHFGCSLGPRWRGQRCLAARCRWGSQPCSSSAGRGGSQRAHPAAAFTWSLLYIEEPQHRSKSSEVSLAQPKVLSEGDALLSAAPGCGDGVIPPVTAASFSPPLPRAGGQVLGWVCGPSASLGTELLHRLPTAVPGFAVLPCPLLRHCRVSSCSALPAFACGWRVTALGTVVVTATVRELGRAMVRGPPGGHKALGRLLSLSVGENTVIRQKEGQ